MIYLGHESRARISSNILAVVPQPGSGFIFGTEDTEGNRTVTDIFGLNRKENFSISEADLSQALEYGNQHELKLLGIYTSRTNEEAIPDEDLLIADHPEFTYLIYSVNNSELGALRAWRFSETAGFTEELISDKPLA